MALGRDGLVLTLLPTCAVALDVSLDPADRAAALRGVAAVAPLAAQGAVLVLAAAAWVHLGGAPPVVVDLALTSPRRSRRPGIRLRTTRYRPDGLVSLGGLSVTTPLQTAADLARAAALRSEPSDKTASEALAALVRAGIDLSAVRALLLSEPRRGNRLARELLAGYPSGSVRAGGTGAASGRTPVTR